MLGTLSQGILALVLLSTQLWAQNVTFVKKDFEAGVLYTASDVVASASHSCHADDYRLQLEWGNGEVAAASSTARCQVIFYNGANRCVVFPGTYTIFDGGFGYPLSAAEGQTFTQTVEFTLHCLDWTGTAVQRFNQQATVHQPIPVNQLSVSPATVKAGAPFSLTVTLEKPAPASDIRVFLTWTDENHKPVGGMPPYVDVPSGHTPVTVVLNAPAVTLAGADGMDAAAGTPNVVEDPIKKPKTIIVQGFTIGAQKTATLRVTP